jgi:hypothetical protein
MQSSQLLNVCEVRRDDCLNALSWLIGLPQLPRWPFRLISTRGIFRSYSAKGANREPAPSMSLQVFHVGSGSVAGFLERLHRAMAISAAHDLVAFCERFEDGAWQPPPTHLHLALRHHRGFLLRSH